MDDLVYYPFHFVVKSTPEHSRKNCKVLRGVRGEGEFFTIPTVFALEGPKERNFFKMEWYSFLLRSLPLCLVCLDFVHGQCSVQIGHMREYAPPPTGITKCDEFITNCDRYYKVRWIYYKLRQVLQSAMIITNCDSTDHKKYFYCHPVQYLKLPITAIWPHRKRFKRWMFILLW